MTREKDFSIYGPMGMAHMGHHGPKPGGGGGGFVHKSQAVKALKETMQSGHRTGLPPVLLEYFKPRDPLPPATPLRKKKQPVPFSGVAQYVPLFAGPQDPEEDTSEPKPRLFRNPELNLQCRLNTETKQEKQIRLSDWKREEAAARAEEASKAWDPNRDSKAEGDPFRTLFVSRLSYDVTEKKLKREFEEFGPIKRVRIVTDKNGKSRGYAFIEFEDKKDMKEAYKAADGRKIEGRRVLVDVERGRTVETWKPRRLGGGLGGEGRAPKPPKKAPPGSVSSAAIPDPDRLPIRAAPRERDSGRDRDRERDRKREREPSPRRDREREKRRRDAEDGEVDRRDRDREYRRRVRD